MGRRRETETMWPFLGEGVPFGETTGLLCPLYWAGQMCGLRESGAHAPTLEIKICIYQITSKTDYSLCLFPTRWAAH